MTKTLLFEDTTVTTNQIAKNTLHFYRTLFSIIILINQQAMYDFCNRIISFKEANGVTEIQDYMRYFVNLILKRLSETDEEVGGDSRGERRVMRGGEITVPHAG